MPKPTSQAENPAAHHRRGVALMLLTAAAFTADILIVRALAQHGSVDVWLISCARFIVGLALVGLLYRREFTPTHLYSNRKLVVLGLVGGRGV